MEGKSKMRRAIITRRKNSQINNMCPKSERNASLRKVSNILRKNEAQRSAEEKALLTTMTDEVKEVKCRLKRRENLLDRNKEREDSETELRNKCKNLAEAMKQAKHLVVYTGAGISTAADIPDYRGPNGVWTLLQQGKNVGKHDFTKAAPTYTHMALKELYMAKLLKFVVSQNCDGLHLRSGLPKRALSEVHGNMYVEVCGDCKPNLQYWRLFDTTERTARYYHKTGRICHVCGASLLDSIVHFGERGVAPWPLNWSGALQHAARADVILCLGSSLKVLRKYPWLWAMERPVAKRPDVFIVNLQWTPKDDVAQLKINGRCDKVMSLVMEYLNMKVPRYDKTYDPVFAHASYLSPKELHTTTQPMLVRSKPKEESDTDEDCPLVALKSKLKTETTNDRKHVKTYEINGILDEALDLSIKKEKDNEINGAFVDIKEDRELNVSLKSENGLTNGYHSSEETIVNGPKCETDEKCVKGLDGEVYENVQVEMKTEKNETHKVQIIIKRSPIKNENSESVKDEGVQTNHTCRDTLLPLDTGQADEKNSNNLECDNCAQNFDEPINLSKSLTKNCIAVNKNLSICRKLMGCGEKYAKTVMSSTPKLVNSLRNFRRLKENKINYKSITNCESKDFLPHDSSKFKENNGYCELKNGCLMIPDIACKPIDLSLNVKKSDSELRRTRRNRCNTLKLRNGYSKTLSCEFVVNTKIHKKNGIIKGVLDLSVSHRNRLKDNFEISSIKNDDAFVDECQSLARVIIDNALALCRRETKLLEIYSGFHTIIAPVPFVQYDFQEVFDALLFMEYGRKLIEKNKKRTLRNTAKRRNTSVEKSVLESQESVSSNKKKKQDKVRKPECDFCYKQYKVYSCNFYVPHNMDDRFEKWVNNKLVMCDCCGESSSSEEDVDEDLSDGSKKDSNNSKKDSDCSKKDSDSSKNENVPSKNDSDISILHSNCPKKDSDSSKVESDSWKKESENFKIDLPSSKSLSDISKRDSDMWKINENKHSNNSVNSVREVIVKDENNSDSNKNDLSLKSIALESVVEKNNGYSEKVVQPGWFGKGYRKNRRRKR